METDPKEQLKKQSSGGDDQTTASSRNCLITVILLQVNYVNNSGTYPVRAKLHANIDGQDLEDSRTLEAGGTVDLPLWYRESEPGRCGTDVEISFVMDVSLSPRAETSPLDAHLSEMRTYKCPSYKDHEVFKLTVGEPDDSHVIFDFVFGVRLECRDVKR